MTLMDNYIDERILDIMIDFIFLMHTCEALSMHGILEYFQSLSSKQKGTYQPVPFALTTLYMSRAWSWLYSHTRNPIQ